jgi:hypothetical protein
VPDQPPRDRPGRRRFQRPSRRDDFDFVVVTAEGKDELLPGCDDPDASIEDTVRQSHRAVAAIAARLRQDRTRQSTT